jgi:hypothetical protein
MFVKPMDIKLRSFDGVVVCGQKGTGKTVLERTLLSGFQDVFVFDTLEEFTDFPHYVPQTDSPLELDKIAKQVYKRGNCYLVVSEAELYLPVYKPLPPNVFKLLTRGRHNNTGIMVDTRRIAELNKTVFGLAEWCFVFRHFSPNDQEYLKKFIPKDTRELSALEDYHFWVYHRNLVEVHEPLPYRPMVKPRNSEAKE